jgi:hypothetical protein
MKLKINGYRLKFKKSASPQILCWLSGLVHTLAAVDKNATACLLSDLDHGLEVSIPDVAKATNEDRMDARYACFYPSDLAALKKARRKVASFVQLAGVA